MIERSRSYLTPYFVFRFLKIYSTYSGEFIIFVSSSCKLSNVKAKGFFRYHHRRKCSRTSCDGGKRLNNLLQYSTVQESVVRQKLRYLKTKRSLYFSSSYFFSINRFLTVLLTAQKRCSSQDCRFVQNLIFVS